MEGWIEVNVTRPGKYYNRTEEEAAARVERHYFCSETCIAKAALSRG
jgi:hypothetical protein